MRSNNPFVPHGLWMCAQPNSPALYTMRVVDTASHAEGPVSTARVRLDPPAPNPFNPSTTLRLSLDRDQQVSLRIHDAAGRCVRTLHRGHLPVGTHEFTWDGHDDRGHAAASGIYFASVRGDHSEFGRRKLVLVK